MACLAVVGTSRQTLELRLGRPSKYPSIPNFSYPLHSTPASSLRRRLKESEYSVFLTIAAFSLLPGSLGFPHYLKRQELPAARSPFAAEGLAGKRGAAKAPQR